MSRAVVSGAGDSARIGGVPNRGGLLPNDSLKADERADSPGPGSDDWPSSRPGSGVCVVEGSSDASWAGVGICCTGTEPTGRDGTGEPSRAVDCSRETEAEGELRSERCDEDGTARGFVASEASFAMLGMRKRCLPPFVLSGAPSIALWKPEISSCSEWIGPNSSELLFRRMLRE